MIVFCAHSVFSEGNATLEEKDDFLIVKNRCFRHSSAALIVPKFKRGKTRVCLKLKEGSQDAFIVLYHKVIYENNGEMLTDYDEGTKRKVTDKDWVWLEGEYCTPPGVDKIIAYFIQESGEPFSDIIIKEISVEEIATEEVTTQIEAQPFRIGAIRWDAYFSTEDPQGNVSREVAKALSPEEFHFRAPYFAKVNEQGNIEFPYETQERFDNEAQLAIDAGIDYFAYCWYRENDVMKYARKRHLTSSLRDKIKMVAIVNVFALDEDTLTDLAKVIKEDVYLKVDGHPLIYVFDAIRTNAQSRQRITDYVLKEGVKQPYYVGMNAVPRPYFIHKLKGMGFDAVGSYGFSSCCEGETFASFAMRNEEMAKMRNSMDIQHVTALSLGHDFRPRIKNPVSWMGGKYYSIAATEEEIYDHVKSTLDIAKENKSKVNSLLIYAWNEHDEGGWICPTITGDGYYQAVKKAISETKR